MTSEILEENVNKLPYMSLNSNHENHLENIQRMKNSVNFIKIKLDEIEGPSDTFLLIIDDSKRVSKKNK